LADTAWRCYRASDGDVKYAARESHVVILESKGYVCTLDPDLDFDTISIFDGVDYEEGA
jgi:hypothetical protein